MGTDQETFSTFHRRFHSRLPPGRGVPSAGKLSGLAGGEQRVGTLRDDAEYPAGGRQVLGGEVEQAGRDFRQAGADLTVTGPAGFGERHRTVADLQRGGGTELGDGGRYLCLAELSGPSDRCDQLVLID